MPLGEIETHPYIAHGEIQGSSNWSWEVPSLWMHYPRQSIETTKQTTWRNNKILLWQWGHVFSIIYESKMKNLKVI